MIFVTVVIDGRVTPPHFIEAGLRINTTVHLKILMDIRMARLRKKQRSQTCDSSTRLGPALG